MTLFDHLRSASRVAKYKTAKGTPEHAEQMAREHAKTVAFLETLGYSTERSTRAADDYAAAAAETRLGPDWPGFRSLAKEYGLAD